MSEKKRQACQIIIVLENDQLKVDHSGNMGTPQIIAGIEILKHQLLNNALGRRDPMIQVPGMLRGDLKRVPS